MSHIATEVRLIIERDLKSFSDESLERMLKWGCLHEDVYLRIYEEISRRERILFKDNFEVESIKIADSRTQIKPWIDKMRALPAPYSYLDADMFKERK